MIAAADAVWCGSTNGGTVTSGAPGASMPATECTAVTSSASAADSGGSSPGSRVASIVFPAPGGPTMATWCPPAAASSNASRASG